MSRSPSWSFSSIKQFDNCPKQYYHLKVLKEHPMEETEAILYGNRFHKAAEEYVRDGTPLPKEFEPYRVALDKIIEKYPGEVHCELKFALDENLEPCSFKSKEAWWRGIADLLIINGDRAFCVDYKTGSAKYADQGQLELMALAVFKHYPHIKKVKAGLFFVKGRSFPKETYTVYDQDKLWVKWFKNYGQLRTAHETGVFNPRSSGLCRKHCPVVSCVHNGRN